MQSEPYETISNMQHKRPSSSTIHAHVSFIIPLSFLLLREKSNRNVRKTVPRPRFFTMFAEEYFHRKRAIPLTHFPGMTHIERETEPLNARTCSFVDVFLRDLRRRSGEM